MKSTKKRPKPRTAADLLANVARGGVPPWKPPTAELRDEIDTLLREGAKDPSRAVGAIRIGDWLETDYGVTIGRTALNTYLRRRRIALGLAS